MNIIIPLGGKGLRFKNEGYTDPKPLIKIFNKEIIFYVLDNLHITILDKIFIIYNKELNLYNFTEIIHNKYPTINVIQLENDTNGASETLYIGLTHILEKYSYCKKTLIIDGDTFYTDDILTKFRNCETNGLFYVKNYDIHPIYSYIHFNKKNHIDMIKEKIKISDNANTGAYGFSDIHVLYLNAKYIVENNIKMNSECYISCIVDYMIQKKYVFCGIELNNYHVHILGTPKQLKEFEELNY
jgi:dTDP-glucose pyrophosphorylase